MLVGGSTGQELAGGFTGLGTALLLPRAQLTYPKRKTSGKSVCVCSFFCLQHDFCAYSLWDFCNLGTVHVSYISHQVAS